MSAATEHPIFSTGADWVCDLEESGISGARKLRELMCKLGGVHNDDLSRLNLAAALLPVLDNNVAQAQITGLTLGEGVYDMAYLLARSPGNNGVVHSIDITADGGNGASLTLTSLGNITTIAPAANLVRTGLTANGGNALYATSPFVLEVGAGDSADIDWIYLTE